MATLERQDAPSLPTHGLSWVRQIDRHRSQTPDRPALRQDGRTVTWAELDDRTRRLASVLAASGIAAGDRVALLMTNRLEFVETLVAAHRLGAILVPLNFRLVASEIEYLLTDSGATAVVVEQALVSGLPGTAASLPTVVVGSSDVPGPPEYESAIAAAAPSAADGPSDLSSPALILYTSGTTGRPKGAVWTHENLIAGSIMMIQVLRMTSDDEVSAVTAPMFHMASILHLVPTVFLGYPTVVVPSGNFDAGDFLDLLETERVTSAFLVPTQWQTVCEGQQARPRTLALRNLAWGAAPATPGNLRAMSETFPDASIVSSFGQTEASITLVLGGRDKLGSVGRPLPLVDVRVVDPDMNDVVQGEVGEIVYRGPAVMAEFWNNPTATAEAFRGGWFHSGDLVRQDEDGYFHVVDRIKDMIISGGENIYSAELETVLSEHPAIAEVAVVPAAHEKWGETPVAFVVPVSGDVDAQDILDFCGSRLARYKIPTRVIGIDQLPRNATGKVQKVALRDLIRD
ncbi:AMP-binding protein [Rhodococcus sp. NPDC003318]|uniref:AMP-binding protein n=1 Tax=Rhodococcus sp. NPDC003318 TaxID=3364503 RepID=UPI0036C86D77